MKATTAVHCDIYQRYLGIPKSTAMHFAQQLRKDESVLRRGKQGAAGAIGLTAAETASWTIALCAATATTRKSPDPVETVKLARAAVRLSDPDLDARAAPEALDGLAIGRAETFGEAIDSLLNDMR